MKKGRRRAMIISLSGTLGALAAATLCALLVVAMGVGREGVIMVYLLGILFVTILTRGYWYALISSVASVMLLNYFFTEPRYTLVINSAADVMLVAFFLITSIVSGTVTARLQEEMSLANKNERTARLLYEVTAGFVHATGERAIAQRGIGYIQDYTGGGARVELNGACYGDALQGADERHSLSGASRPLGTLRVQAAQGDDPTRELYVRTVATQLGIALDREYTYREREEIRVAMEREKLRSTLLRAVAHDLRSPLTALSGLSALLSEGYDGLSDAERRHLAADISEEIVWLTNLVENILNMTRINESSIAISKQDEVIDDLASEAARHMARLLKNRSFAVKLPDEVIMVPMDGRLIVQVLINLLDNAIKHTEAGGHIWLAARAQEGGVLFTVEDDGEGIDPKVMETLFEGFVTLERRVTDGRRGIGLGLAICKAVVEAHGGWIRAENREGGGARFTFALPMEGKACTTIPQS